MEQQAIGRVLRPGQRNPVCYVYRLELKGPAGETTIDAELLARNTSKEAIDQATSNHAE